eukprot:scaffold1795_cov187-Alexandrium_tamarense.AAC.17
MRSGARRVTPEVGGDTCVLCVSGKNVCNTHWKTIGGDYELWRPVCELSGSVDAGGEVLRSEVVRPTRRRCLGKRDHQECEAKRRSRSQGVRWKCGFLCESSLIPTQRIMMVPTMDAADGSEDNSMCRQCSTTTTAPSSTTKPTDDDDDEERYVEEALNALKQRVASSMEWKGGGSNISPSAVPTATISEMQTTYPGYQYGAISAANAPRRHTSDFLRLREYSENDNILYHQGQYPTATTANQNYYHKQLQLQQSNNIQQQIVSVDDELASLRRRRLALANQASVNNSVATSTSSSSVQINLNSSFLPVTSQDERLSLLSVMHMQGGESAGTFCGSCTEENSEAWDGTKP